MEFDLTDPLGDILSDGSNDSFFNDDKYKAAPKPKATHSTNIESKKSNLFELEEKKPDPQNDDSKSKKAGTDWLGLTESKPSTPVVKQIETKVGSSNVVQNKSVPLTKDIKGVAKKSDKLDFLDDLQLFDEPLKDKTKSNVYLDDLLGKSSVIKSSNKNIDSERVAQNVNKETSFTYAPTQSTVVKSNLKVKDDQKVKEDDKASSVNKRQKSSKDWLGILSEDNDDILSNYDKKQDQKSFSELLNLSEKKDKVDVVKESVPESKADKKDDEKIQEQQQQPAKPEQSFQNPTQLQMDVNDFLSKMTLNNSDINLGGGMNIEQQGAALCLQQQESHLMVALQLKAQEERLAAMHERIISERQAEAKRIQKEVASGQKEQLNRLLQGQVDHRLQMQQIIAQHQQRINQHIQSLLMPGDTMENLSDDKDIYNEPVIINGGENKKVEFLKTQLDQITSVLKDYHEKEIELIENSYRRQIVLANESILIIEDRYKAENEKLIEFYNAKIKKLELDHVQLQEQTDNTVKTLIEKHNNEKSNMETKHLKDIEILQQQHHVVVQNIRYSVELEHSTMKEVKNYSDKLDNIIKEVDNNNDMCNKMMIKLDRNAENDLDVKLKCLQTKEEQINRLLDNLELQRSVYESEINKKNTFLQTFEERMKQQMQIIDDEKASFECKKHLLEVENQSIRSEYENLKKQLQLEKESFQKSILYAEKSNREIKAEIDEQFKKLETEKLSLLNERKSVTEIKANCQTMKSKLDNEMQALEDKKIITEKEQEKVFENEAKLMERSRELEMLTHSALAKQKNAENKMTEAINLKKKFEEKLSSIQEHFLSINAREQQIANDKIALSRERLSIYNQRAESGFGLCGHCRNSLYQQNRELKNDNILRYQEPNLDLTFDLNTYRSDLLDLSVKRDLIKENLIDINNDDMYSNKVKRVEKFK